MIRLSKPLDERDLETVTIVKEFLPKLPPSKSYSCGIDLRHDLEWIFRGQDTWTLNKGEYPHRYVSADITIQALLELGYKVQIPKTGYFKTNFPYSKFRRLMKGQLRHY